MNARGVALIMGLILLAAISLLALTSARGMVLQHRMAGNLDENLEALHNASIAAADARSWLESRADVERETGCPADCLLPVAIRNAGELPARPEFESAAWWRANGYLAGADPESGDSLGYGSGGVEPARWIMEERPGSVAVSETILARPWDGEYDPAPYPATDPPGGFCSQFGESVACGTLAWRQRK